ncbi:hypothetical protein OG874_03635 [Nocardia sp. NBC_00565]|uniref:DUF6973 domain-containing protein n=1 Tax=Nocardia sp. NBC_00565 TaxID=2975993 RepID=UPI002E808D14|nr:hypothetical protein [Nocardia sp. NBC_00565]WUC04310.1 hypothetical protein OG874_03635 [Nocardia sp. NBC_00565]
MSEATPLRISQVLAWNLNPADDLALSLSRVAEEIEAEVEAAASALAGSYEYFNTESGESARQRAQDDRKDALTTVDIYQELSGVIASTTAVFEGMILLIRAAIKEVEGSEWDLFYTDDGEVMSWKSNWEWMKKYWWSPGTAIAHKELEEARLTGGLRVCLNRIQEADLMAEGTIQGVLEKVPNSARQALIAMPTDTELAKILTDYQTDATKETVVWPSGWVLDIVRGWDPTFKAGAMPREEATALENLIGKHGLLGLKEFYDIKTEAEQAAKDQFPGFDVETQERVLSDGHGDAFRHAYWNARMTQEFGEDWTQTYTTAHEKSGGNPPAREAMDLYNNKLGREIAIDNRDASPEQLRTKISEAIQDGHAVVLKTPEGQSQPQIIWSNQVGVAETDIQSGVGLPLPGKR